MRKFIQLIFGLVLIFHLNGFSFDFYMKVNLQKPDQPSRKYLLARQAGDSLLVLTDQNTIEILNLQTLEIASVKIDQNRLQTRMITSLALSPEGDILLGSEKGLFRLSANSGELLEFDKSLPNLLVQDLICIGKDLLILFPTRLIVHNGTAWKDFDLKRFNYLGNFFKLEKCADGSVTVAAEEGAIFIGISGVSVKTKPVLGGKTRDIHANQFGQLFILSEKKLFKRKNQQLELVSGYTKDGKLFTDPLGQVWIYSPKQMYVCSKGTVAPIKLPNEIASEEILGVFHHNTPETFFLTGKNLYLFKNQPHDPVKFYTTIFDSIQSDLEQFLLSPEHPYFKQLWQNFDKLYARQQSVFLKAAIDAKAVYQLDDPDFATLIKRIKNLPDKQLKSGLLDRLRLAAIQTDPELAVYINQSLSKLAVRPDEIIRSKLLLAETYQAAGQPDHAEVVYRQTGFNFPLTTPGVDKALLAITELSDNADEKSRIWRMFTNYHSDPLVSTARKFFNYSKYCRKKFEKTIGHFPNEPKFIYNTPSTWKIFGANIGVYAIDDKGHVFYSDPGTLNWSSINRIRGAEKIITTSLGSIVLTQAKKIMAISPTGIADFQPAPPQQGRILNVWNNQGFPVLLTATHLIAYNSDTGGWQTTKIPTEIRQFQILNAFEESDGYWYVCTPAKIYRFRPDAAQVEGLPNPPEIISIRGASRAPGNGFYLATNSGLYLYQDEKFQVVELTSGFSGKDVSLIKSGKKANETILVADSAAWISSPGGWMTLINSQGFPFSQITDIASDGEGFVYCLQNSRLLVWDLGQYGNILAALNSNQTADLLFRNGRYAELEQYLNRLTRHPLLAPWALEYLGRTMLAQKKYDLALEQYQIASSSDADGYWVNDSAATAFIYRLLKANQWRTVIKALDFLKAKFGKSPLITYNCQLFGKHLEEAPYAAFQSEKTAVLLWWIKNYPELSKKNHLPEILQKLVVSNLRVNHSTQTLETAVRELEKVSQGAILQALLKIHYYQNSKWKNFKSLQLPLGSHPLPMMLSGCINELKLSIFLRENTKLL